MNKIYFARVKDNAIIPTKRIEDAGYDLYSLNREGWTQLEPGEIKIIPTGIAVAFSSDKVLIVKERGSTGNIGLAVRMGVIDSGFRGEIAVGLNNTSNKTIILSDEIDKITIIDDIVYYPLSKAIAQAVLISIPQIESEEVSYDKLLSFTSERMLSKLGESGK